MLSCIRLLFAKGFNCTSTGKTAAAIGSAQTAYKRGSPPVSHLFFSYASFASRTFFESALSSHGYNCSPVSWKSLASKSRSKGTKKAAFVLTHFYFPSQPGRFLLPFSLLSYREKGVAGGFPCLPDVSDTPPIPVINDDVKRGSTMCLEKVERSRFFFFASPNTCDAASLAKFTFLVSRTLSILALFPPNHCGEQPRQDSLVGTFHG